MEKKRDVSRLLHRKIARIMKITTVLLLVSIIHLSANTLAYAQKQRVSVTIENGTFYDAISQIEEQSEFMFFYKSEEINDNQRITLNAKDRLVSDVLNEILKNRELSYKINGKHIIISKQVALIQQQAKAISGVVVDDLGDPLIGVNVVVKGTTNGIITDIDGKFALTQVGDNAVLVISYVGYVTQEIRVGNNTTFSVTLREDTQNLEEVVIVGYGAQKKQTLSGAVTSISSEDIQTTKTDNLVTNLQGKMPGLLIRQRTGEPGDYSNLVSIRGFGDPLVVIDGVARDGTAELAQLNPDDIESISILKDASAAIYGLNSGNGVLIVTTKQGEAGKPKFMYQGKITGRVPTGMELTVDAYTYRVMANEMQRNIGATPTYSDDILEKYKNNEPGYTDHDWLDMYMSDMAMATQHNFSVRGGSDNVKYFTSFSYTEDNGLLKSGIQFNKRFNLRSNLTAKITKDLELAVNLSGVYGRIQQPREPFIWVFKTLQVNDRGKDWHTLDNENHLTAIDPENKNAHALVDPKLDGYNRRKEYRYQSNVTLTYKAPFLKGLTLTGTAAFDHALRNSSMLQKSYDIYDYYTDQYVTTYGEDKYNSRFRTDQRLNFQGRANYTHSWNKMHNLGIMVGIEATTNRTDELEGERKYADLYTHDILNQGTATTASNAGYRSFEKKAGYFGRLNYDFAGKYLVEALFRYDGSYRYSRSSRWGFFPAASIGWRISEESFLKNTLPFVNNLKLRASVGKTGRDQGSAYQYIPGYSSVNNRGYVFDEGELTVAMMPPGVVNDKMSWVNSTTYNIGLDFDLWNGKFGGVVEYFERKNTGQLANPIVDVPNTFGATIAQENLNSSVNRGIELELYHRGKIGNDFSYGVSANVTFSREKRLYRELAGYSSQWSKYRSGDNLYRYTGRMALYQYNGQYQSLDEYETAPLMGGSMGNSKILPGSYRLKDVNGDGRITSDDQTYDWWTYGNVNPPLQYGLTLYASYKSFDINALFQGAALYSINYRNQDIWGYGRYPTLHKRFLDRWHTEDPTADPYDPATKWKAGYFPAIRSNMSNTMDEGVVDVWRPSASYLRLKNLEIGYNLPRHIVKMAGLSNVRIFANGTNLLTFCKKELREYDPEKWENDWDAGLSYPIMRDFSIGLTVNF